MWLVLIFALVLLITSGQADQNNSDNTTTPLSREECQQLIIDHKLDDSINGKVDYESGVDVTGKSVVPADLTPPKSYGFDKNSHNGGVDIGLEIPLRKMTKIHPQRGPNPTRSTNYAREVIRQSDASVGFVRIKPDGSVYINGEKVGDEEREHLSNQCRQMYPNL